MEEKKKNTGLVVVVAIFCLLLGGVGGYFITANFLNKNKTNVQNNKNTITENNNMTVYSVSDSKITKLVENLIYSNEGTACEDNIWFFANNKKIHTNDINNLQAFEMVFEYNDLNKDGKITYDEIEKQIQKILGKDFKFNSNTDISRCTGPSYDSKTKELYYMSGPCGGTCGIEYYSSPSYKIVKAVDMNGTLEMNIKVVFETEDNKVYSEYSKKNLIAIYDVENEMFFDSKKEVLTLDSVLNKGSDYRFTFKLEDGNYVFISSEPIK